MSGQDTGKNRIFSDIPMGLSEAGGSGDLAYPGLRVRMLSAFTMEFRGQSVNMTRGNNNKLIQLFAMLLLGGEKGVMKRELIGNFYGSQEWRSDTNKSINNLLWRLRKQWAAWGMDGANLIFDGGSCRFEADFPVWVDVIEFQKKSLEALAYADGDSQEQIAMLKEAAAIYTGNFLDEFCTELWVIHKQRELKQLYERVVRTLGSEYERMGDLPNARQLYHDASLIFPYESWQLAEIDCLISMNDYNEAYELYQNTERFYYEEMGISLGQEYLKRLTLIEEHERRRVRRLSDIVEPLREGNGGGAFYCSYSVFFNFCQVLVRLAERSGQSMFLLLCTWNSHGGVKRLMKNPCWRRSRWPFCGMWWAASSARGTFIPNTAAASI